LPELILQTQWLGNRSSHVPKFVGAVADIAADESFHPGLYTFLAQRAPFAGTTATGGESFEQGTGLAGYKGIANKRRYPCVGIQRSRPQDHAQGNAR